MKLWNLVIIIDVTKQRPYFDNLCSIMTADFQIKYSKNFKVYLDSCGNRGQNYEIKIKSIISFLLV